MICPTCNYPMVCPIMDWYCTNNDCGKPSLYASMEPTTSTGIAAGDLVEYTGKGLPWFTGKQGIITGYINPGWNVDFYDPSGIATCQGTNLKKIFSVGDTVQNNLGQICVIEKIWWWGKNPAALLVKVALRGVSCSYLPTDLQKVL